MITFEPLIYIPIIVICIIITIIKFYNLSPRNTVLLVWIILLITPPVIVTINNIVNKQHANGFELTIPISFSLISISPLIYMLRLYLTS